MSSQLTWLATSRLCGSIGAPLDRDARADDAGRGPRKRRGQGERRPPRFAIRVQRQAGEEQQDQRGDARSGANSDEKRAQRSRSSATP